MGVILLSGIILVLIIGLCINPIMVILPMQVIGNMFIQRKISTWIDNKEWERAFSEKKMKVIKILKLIIIITIYIFLIPTIIQFVLVISSIVKNSLY